MKPKFASLIGTLEDTGRSANQSDDSGDISWMKASLDAVMKFVHDCQHSSRGFVHEGGSRAEIFWFLKCIRQVLDVMRSLDLEGTDEYLDLLSESALISSRHEIADRDQREQEFEPAAPSTHDDVRY